MPAAHALADQTRLPLTQGQRRARKKHGRLRETNDCQSQGFMILW